MLSEVLRTALSPTVLAYMAIGVFSGICIGSLPGLTATMGVALLLPLTFGMGPAEGILMLLGIYVGAIYGGSISAILLRTPGTPASAATAIDGYEFTKRGEAGRALGIATVSSYIGGVISVACLWLVSPQLAKLALKFSSAEFFLLAMFGLTIIANISGKNIGKGLICGLFGMLVATVGIDKVTSYIRFSDNVNVLSGIPYIPIMIGLFAMSQAFESIEMIFSKDEIQAKVKNILPQKSDLKEIFKIAPITGLVGTLIGIIPGAGADIGSFVGYNTARTISKDADNFGKGAPAAIAAAEGGNNGVTGGAMIPMLTLGVPGDAVAAIMIGALTIQGLAPGPMLFQNNKTLVYTIFFGMFVANTLMLIMGLSLSKVFTKVLSVPKAILTPVIFALCVVGSYAMRNNLFDVWVMLIAGIIGYVLNKIDVPTSPAILGLILGPMAESNFRTALLKSGGNIGVFFETPISWFFICLIVLTIFGGTFKKLFKQIFAAKSQTNS